MSAGIMSLDIVTDFVMVISIPCIGSEPFGRLGLKTKRDNSLFQGLIHALSEALIIIAVTGQDRSPLVKFLPRFPAFLK